MKANATVISNLQVSCGLMAHLAAQYQVDVRQLRVMGMGWLACRVKKWYGGSEQYLRKFIDRLLYFDTDPEYDAGAVSGAASIKALLQRDEDLVYKALDQLRTFRKAAWNVVADYTPDIYEHAIGELENQAFKIERELNLIAKLGENGYVASRLEDE